MATKRGVTAARRARHLPAPIAMPNETLDRLTRAYRYYAERGWLAASVDLPDLRAVLEANGVEIPNV